MKTFKFRFFTGPVGVNEYARRLQSAGIHAQAGTQHVYGEITSLDHHAAWERINRPLGWRIRQTEVWPKTFGSMNRAAVTVLRSKASEVIDDWALDQLKQLFEVYVRTGPHHGAIAFTAHEAKRLRPLLQDGFIAPHQDPTDRVRRPHQYAITEKGRDLLQALGRLTRKRAG